MEREIIADDNRTNVPSKIPPNKYLDLFFFAIKKDDSKTLRYIEAMPAIGIFDVGSFVLYNMIEATKAIKTYNTPHSKQNSAHLLTSDKNDTSFSLFSF